MIELGLEGLNTVFKAVAQSCRALEIEFYVVGAIAKNHWLVKGEKEVEGTKDIDFAVYVPSLERYQALKSKLISDNGYQPSSTNAFRLVSPSGLEIDIMPFGGIEEGGNVRIPGKGLVDINLAGFQEVYDQGQIRTEIDGVEYMICSIASVAILKLIAYDDRPEMRSKDIRDIASIIMNYPDIEKELIWEEYIDSYDVELGLEQNGLIVLGKEMKKIIEPNNELHQRLIGIIEGAQSLDSPIADLMRRDIVKDERDTQIAKLNLILKGLR